MHRFERFLGAEVSAAGAQVVIVEVPDEAGPCGVHQPLDHARGDVLVAAVRFEHGAFRLVGHDLALHRIVVEVLRDAVTVIERSREIVGLRELAAAGVKIPTGIPHRPEMLRRQHLLQAGGDGDGGAGAGFGDEAKCAAAARIG